MKSKVIHFKPAEQRIYDSNVVKQNIEAVNQSRKALAEVLSVEVDEKLFYNTAEWIAFINDFKDSFLQFTDDCRRLQRNINE